MWTAHVWFRISYPMGWSFFFFFLSIQIIFLADKIKKMHSAYTTIAFPLLSVSLQSICRLLSGSSVGCGSSTGYNCLWARKWQTFKGKIISNEEIFFSSLWRHSRWWHFGVGVVLFGLCQKPFLG